jgi:hypothetical protein
MNGIREPSLSKALITKTPASTRSCRSCKDSLRQGRGSAAYHGSLVSCAIATFVKDRMEWVLYPTQKARIRGMVFFIVIHRFNGVEPRRLVDRIENCGLVNILPCCYSSVVSRYRSTFVSELFASCSEKEQPDCCTATSTIYHKKSKRYRIPGVKIHSSIPKVLLVLVASCRYGCRDSVPSQQLSLSQYFWCSMQGWFASRLTRSMRGSSLCFGSYGNVSPRCALSPCRVVVLLWSGCGFQASSILDQTPAD